VAGITTPGTIRQQATDRYIIRHEAREDPIEDPLQTIRKIAEARQFSQKMTDELVSSYLVEPEANRFGVINAFTNTAQKLGPLQRIEMERFAGTFKNTSSTELATRNPSLTASAIRRVSSCDVR
jgi:hypothetical protein